MRELPPDEVTTLGGIPITTLARTLLDLASDATSRAMRRVIVRAVRQHDDAADQLLALISRYPGRRGVPMLRALLEEDGACDLTHSQAEERMKDLVKKGGLPLPELNVKIGRDRVDCLWRQQQVVLEVDGFAYHSSRARFENDRRRDAELAARGFRVIRVTWRQLVREPEAVLVRLAVALAASRP